MAVVVVVAGAVAAAFVVAAADVAADVEGLRDSLRHNIRFCSAIRYFEEKIRFSCEIDNKGVGSKLSFANCLWYFDRAHYGACIAS